MKRSTPASLTLELPISPKEVITLFGPTLRNVTPRLLRAAAGRNDTFLRMALRHAEKTPNNIALATDETTWTWAELANRSNNIAHLLQMQGVRAGNVVALFATNSPLYIATILACTRIGAVCALVNHHLRSMTLAHALRAAEPTLIVAAKELAPALRELGEALHPPLGTLYYNDAASADFILNSTLDALPVLPAKPLDDFVYIYTSGTTGLPKPCRISHARAVLAGALFSTWMFRLSEGDKLYCALPLYHANGLLLGVGSCMASGTPMVLSAEFSVSEFWNDIHRHQATAFLYIGEMCRYLLAAPKHPLESPNPLRVAVGNGLRPEIWTAFQERFGINDVREFYGATEAPGIILNITAQPRSVGRVPFNGLAGWLRLVRYDTQSSEYPRDKRGFLVPCQTGESGELLIRIRSVTLPALQYTGYTDAEASEAKVLRDVFRKGDAYFRSGDLMTQDEEGYFYFVDRVGDTFRWKGENVSTQEVSDVLSTCPGVQELAVVGIPLPNHDGQAGLAVIVQDENAEFDPRAFWIRAQQLPSYAQPMIVRVVERLPMTSTFKVMKQRLRSDGINPSIIHDPLYLRQDEGYAAFTALHWKLLTDGALKL